MDITLIYNDGEVKISEKDRSDQTNEKEYIFAGLSDSFKLYVEELMEVFERHMKRLDQNGGERCPKGKLEISLIMGEKRD